MEKLDHRYIARVVLEAETPLFIGSGESSLLQDALVQKDNHGFPMILGTSLTGVLRHAIEDSKDEKGKVDWQSFFGYQKGNKGLGSQLKVSSAYLILHKGQIAEGLNISKEMKAYKTYFDNLPNRQHVRINEKGVAVDKNLFDNEVVFKGTKFLFELELKANNEDGDKWNALLKELKSQKFRVGQGTRNGYGRLRVAEIAVKEFKFENDFEDYLNLNPSLNSKDFKFEVNKSDNYGEDYIHYKLELKPDDFFIFNVGYGDDEADYMPITEQVISYDINGSIEKLKVKGETLIPATSIKGALSHRTAFHYNKNNKIYADRLKSDFDKIKDIYIGTNNEAVFELFGAQEGVDNRDKDKEFDEFKELNGQRGKVIINDIFIPDAKNDKIFNHVAIDRFTGGAMDGALFSEKVSYFDDPNKIIELDVYVEKLDKDIPEEKKKSIIEAFEDTLIDVCKGLLPLGGMTTKGHGAFTGKLFNNNEKIFDYEEYK